MLPLAEAVRDAGHEVVFATGEAVEPLIGPAGFEVLVSGPSFDDLLAEALTRYPETSFATPEDQQQFGFERLFSEVRMDATIPDVLAHADAWNPDLVVNETADFVGPLVAAQRSAPNATVGIGLLLLDRWLGLAAAAVQDAWRACGLTPRPDAGLYRSLYLNQLPPSLQRPTVDDLPDAMDLRPVDVGAGTALPADLESLGRERPLISVTFGTMFGDAAAVQQVVDGLAGMDADVLVTLGDDADLSSVRSESPRVHVRGFVPQGAVLGRCALVVTHGGVGSFVGPLSHGVPVVMIPMGADQAENAEQLTAVGAGRVLARDELAPDTVARVVTEVLGDDDVARAAGVLRDEIASMPEPSEVVDELVWLTR
jgi:UDP:flavonoid glycosyltransferase YjiC (YdhE family)